MSQVLSKLSHKCKELLWEIGEKARVPKNTRRGEDYQELRFVVRIGDLSDGTPRLRSNLRTLERRSLVRRRMARDLIILVELTQTGLVVLADMADRR